MPFSNVYWVLTSYKKLGKSNEGILRKVQKCWFWAQKCPIYPILGIIRIFLKQWRMILWSVHWVLTSYKKWEKSKEQILRKFKKRWFWAQKCPIYPILGIIRIFLKQWPMLLWSVHWALTSCRKSEKSNEWILRKVRKCLFWAQKYPISPILGIIRVFLKKQARVFP